MTRRTSGLLAVLLAVTTLVGPATAIASASSPALADGLSAAARGIGYVNLHERIPDYHVRVLVPQLLGPGVRAERVNASLRRAAASVTAAWRRKALAELPPASAFPHGHRPAGEFDILPRPSLVASSPLLVDSLLPVLSYFPDGTANQWWAPDAAALPSGRGVSVFALLFADHTAALRAVAAQLRGDVVYEGPVAPNRCVAELRRDQGLPPRGFPGLLTVHAWMALMGRDRSVALAAHGLVVGFDEGDLYDDACGLATFLVPYSIFTSYLGAHARQLVSSFEHEPAAAS